MKKISVLIGALVFLPAISMAGFFGPDNYEECVLDKMKGQHKSMMYTARKACEKKFPFEKELISYGDKIEAAWLTDSSRIKLSITENFGEYSVTRYQAGFSQKSCAEATSDLDYLLWDTFKFVEGVPVASISVKNADKYKCMKTGKIWGKIK